MKILKRFFQIVFWCVAVALILYSGRDLLGSAAGSFLVVKEELQPADTIVVCNGDVERLYQAIQLYNAGLSGYIIFSGGSEDPSADVGEWLRKQAMKAGVPKDRVLLESKAMHTYQHPIFVKPIMISHGFKSAIVVSSPYHMRRVKMLFDRAFHNSGIKLIYYPVEKSWFDPKQWWQSEDGRRIFFSEYGKMVVNFCGVRVNDFAVDSLKKLKGD